MKRYSYEAVFDRYGVFDARRGHASDYEIAICAERDDAEAIVAALNAKEDAVKYQYDFSALGPAFQEEDAPALVAAHQRNILEAEIRRKIEDERLARQSAAAYYEDGDPINPEAEYQRTEVDNAFRSGFWLGALSGALTVGFFVLAFLVVFSSFGRGV